MSASARATDRRAQAGLLACALGGALSWVLLIGWPLRIWGLPVSPHTHLVGALGVDLAGAARYVLAVVVAFGWYSAALWLVLARGVRLPLGAALSGAALLSLSLYPTHPLSSADLFNYISSARVYWVHGANPLTVAPAAFPADPFFPLLSFWQQLPSPYGPLWSLLAGLPLALGGDDPARTVLAFKALAVGGLLLAAWLAARTAERLRPGAATAAIVVLAWNPLAVWHAAGNGHNDAVLLVPLTLAALLLVHGRPGPALLALTVAALLKAAALLLGPLVLVWALRRLPEDWRQPRWWRGWALWPALALALLVAAFAPFWEGPRTLHTMLDEGSYFTVSPPAAMRGALVRVTDAATAEALAGGLARLVFVAAAVLVLRPVWRGRAGGHGDVVAAGAALLLVYLLGAATYFAPWYVLWPLALAAVQPWRARLLAPLLTLTLTAMSILVWATWARVRFDTDGGDWYPMHLLSALAIVLPVGVGAWLCWGATTRSADIEPPVLQGQIARARPER